MRFTKVQGTGNDFILIEPDEKERDWANLAIAMCNRHFGVGGDGILLVLPSKKADIKMRMFNPDGSEAEACGNGLRCVVRYAIEKGVASKSDISVETIAGIRRAKVFRERGRPLQIQVTMGKPAFKAEEIPVTLKLDKKLLNIKSMLDYPVTVGGQKLRLNFVSMGNPHAVYFTDKPVEDFPLAQIGPMVENHRIFPQRANFEVARVLNRKEIEERTWERGAGETLACGSGISAVAVASKLLGYTDSKVNIRASGGNLNVEWDGKSEVMLGGPAETVFTGFYPD